MLLNLNRKSNIVILLALIFGAGCLMIPASFADAVGGAALFLRPASGSFLVGSTFDLSIVLDTKGAAANTVEVELLFPADKIQIANPSIGISVVQVWAAPPSFSNREGKMYFVGGIPSPGIVTSDGIVLTLTFRVIAPGSGEIKFGAKSSVLANDGRGTDMLDQKPSAFFNFLVPPPQGPAVSSPTHPDQNRWYRDTSPMFVWSRSSFATGYSYSIDHDPNGFADTIVEGNVTTVSIQDLKSGIWYFHLRERADSVWGGISHYVVKIDNQPPASFKVNVSPAKRTTNPNPIFRFFTTDAFSGLDYFKMKIISLSGKTVNESFFFEISSPYQAPNFEHGRYQVIVRAVDKAGNSKDEAVTMNIVGSFYQFIKPEGIDLAIFFMPWAEIINFMTLAVIIFAIILLLIWRTHHHHLGHALREDFKKILNILMRRGK